LKHVIILADGMWDLPVERLGGKTPLQAAMTSNMDHMAKNGMVAQVQTIPEGLHPGSDIGNMAILGYNPKIYHTGRAPLEAANMNIILDENQLAVRCNLVTIDDRKMIDYSAGHITTKEADVLIQALNQAFEGSGVSFHTGKSYRHLLVMNFAEMMAYRDIRTVAPHDILGNIIDPHLPGGKGSRIFRDIMDRASKILEPHSINEVRRDLGENPANHIWLWGQGTKPRLTSFHEKRGKKGGIISAVDLVNGIGRLAGLEIIDVPGITGYYDTNFQGKADYAIDFLRNNDFVYIHIEAPDEAGHNGDLKEKIAAIENIDRYVVGTMLNRFGSRDEARILILPDHPTPVELRTHTNSPVGFLMFGKNVVSNGADSYDEVSAEKKGLMFEDGESLLNYFLTNYIN
jgi:2,3-bisphosphoglycerate-independent phosphoglycerate mutase